MHYDFNLFSFFSDFVKCGKFENKKTDQIENLF